MDAGVTIAAIAFYDPSNDALLAAHAEREETIYRALDLAPAEPGNIILMGHNMHLTKASESVRFSSVAQHAGPSWRTVGTHVAEKFPKTCSPPPSVLSRGREETGARAPGRDLRGPHDGNL
jgi:erythromycin esterase-like protein